MLVSLLLVMLNQGKYPVVVVVLNYLMHAVATLGQVVLAQR
jgi:hypothetical protein